MIKFRFERATAEKSHQVYVRTKRFGLAIGIATMPHDRCFCCGHRPRGGVHRIQCVGGTEYAVLSIYRLRLGALYPKREKA